MFQEKLKKSEVIFVDYFDTLVFREVTPRQVLQRWAINLGKKFPELTEEEIHMLPSKRINIFSNLRKKKREEMDKTGVSEVNYDDAIGVLYEEIADQYNIGSKVSFIKISKDIEKSVELGCQFVNKKLLKRLILEKKKGKKIYCVSDFYLNSEDIKEFMYSANVPENLFDDIFVSCDVGKRKANGDIYPFIINKLDINEKKILMIGDNKKSDYENAKEHGLSVIYKPNYIHKSKNLIKNKLGLSYSGKQLQKSMKYVYKNDARYAEYVAIFYIFIKRLYHQLDIEKTGNITFMAREGYYLRELFELYQKLVVSKEKEIKTNYLKCSRRSVMSGIREAHLPESIGNKITIKNWLKSLDLTVEEIQQYVSYEVEKFDELVYLKDSEIYSDLFDNEQFVSRFNNLISDNQKAFTNYVNQFISNGVLRFVDSGWKRTTQNVLENGYGIDTIGYYIGIQIPDKPISELKSYGLIFNECNPKSKYYDFLGTNIPFYQQLLAAPHGSAIKYISKADGSIFVKEKWDSMEAHLFETKIKDLQRYMSVKFQGIAAWDDSLPYDAKIDWFIAKLSMKSSLFAKGKRLKFIRNLTDNYVQNFRQENRGKVQYDYRKVKIGLDIFWKPEKYIRYVSKIQRTDLYDKKMIKIIYDITVRPFYLYVVLWNLIKK